MMTIIDMQAHASVQDLGRSGLRSLGIGQSGAMDKLALQAGNILLKNAKDLPAIEIVLGGMQLFFEQDTPFCITGAFYEAYLDDQPIYSYWRYSAKAGQILKLVRAKIGMYGYLCVQGGFDVAPVLGSCSTDLKAKFGGVEGRYLKTGDRIKTGGVERIESEIGIAPVALRHTIYALPSSEYQAFQRVSQYHFWQSKWTLQSNSDRMGYRFKGETLTLCEPLEMLSHAISFGTIQVPPDGQPIILMADAQTTGGYPKIASVIGSDLGRLAQVRFGNAIRFELVTPQQATQLRRKDEIYLEQVRRVAHGK